jgi:MFS family permease
MWGVFYGFGAACCFASVTADRAAKLPGEPAFPAAVAAYFGDKNFGLIYGLVYTGLGFAGVFPLLAGYLYGRQGDFHGVFILLVVACCTVIFYPSCSSSPWQRKVS